MSMPSLVWRALMVALLAGTLAAQPTVNPPHFSVTPLANVPLIGDLGSLAVDYLGNVFLVDKPFAPTSIDRIHKIGPNGSVTLNFATGMGEVGQLAYHPLQGLVFVVAHSPLLPVISSNVWRLDPSGATFVRSVPVVATGFTIDNHGAMYFGGQGLQGPGLYKWTPAQPQSGLSFKGPGFGSNSILQSMVDGAVLIADGNEVRRWSPLAINTQPFWMGPPQLPNTSLQVNSLGRIPFNQLGSGAMIGHNAFETFSLSGIGRAYSMDLLGNNPSVFAMEPYTFNDRGLQALATGIRQDMYWASVQVAPPPGFQAVISKIKQLPAAGSQGSLLIGSQPGQVSFNIFGNPAGGAPLLLGLRPGISPISAGPLFVPPFGILQLNPLANDYIPLVDGIGVFGPPDIFGVIPVGGHWNLTVTLPPFPTIIQLQAEAVILDPPHAVNGLFFITNRRSFALQ